MDEYAHLDRFAERLNSEKRWDAIFAEIRSIRGNCEDGGWLEDEPFDNASLDGRIQFDLNRTFAYGTLAKVVQKHLLDDFPFPPIAIDELTELALTNLAGLASIEEFKAGVCRLITFINHATNYSVEDIEIGEDIPFPSLLFVDGSPLRELQMECATIWESDYGFWLSLVPDENRFARLAFNVWCKASVGATKIVSRVFARVVPSIGTTLALVYSDLNQPETDSKLPFDIDNSMVSSDLALLKESFFSRLLGSYFLAQAKKTSSFEQRMRNATHLLVEADDQENRVIALSLCFSAIEAMVCDKTEGIVDELSRHVASLLEPIGLSRIEAIAGIKKLYNIRSKVLHGDNLAGTDDDFWRARALAAAVLKAADDWKLHTMRMGEEVDRKDFISELRTISTTGSQMVGIGPELSRFLAF